MNQCVKYLGQRSFSSEVVTSHPYKHTHTIPTALPGSLKWSVKVTESVITQSQYSAISVCLTLVRHGLPFQLFLLSSRYITRKYFISFVQLQPFSTVS